MVNSITSATFAYFMSLFFNKETTNYDYLSLKIHSLEQKVHELQSTVDELEEKLTINNKKTSEDLNAKLEEYINYTYEFCS
jgi:chromosome segregation ATPase